MAIASFALYSLHYSLNASLAEIVSISHSCFQEKQSFLVEFMKQPNRKVYTPINLWEHVEEDCFVTGIDQDFHLHTCQ